MGLTAKSTGKNAGRRGLVIHKAPGDKAIALAGNPNVGKSTVFNELTGMNQHTGNWPGKTVSNAQGDCRFQDTNYTLVDIPGTYSLMRIPPKRRWRGISSVLGNPTPWWLSATRPVSNAI